MDLQDLRAEISALDGQLLELFLRRMAVAEQVAGYKRERGLPILQPAREAEILAWAGQQAGERMAPYARSFFEALMSISKDMQRELLK